MEDILNETSYWLYKYKELYRHMRMFDDVCVQIPSAVFGWALEHGEITDETYHEAEEFFKDDWHLYFHV